MANFDLHIGIDYSGAQTPTSRLSALQVYAATQGLPERITTPAAPDTERWNWTRQEIAEWLIDHARSGVRFMGRPMFYEVFEEGRPVRQFVSLEIAPRKGEGMIEPGDEPHWLGAVLLLFASGCAEQETAQTQHAATSVEQGSVAAGIEDLSVDPVPLLQKLPHVVEVTRHGPEGEPAHRIIHIADWHFVERDAFAADLRSQSEAPLSDQEIDQRYDEFLGEVELVQKQQMALLRALIEDHGLNRVHFEGVTEETQKSFEAKVSALRKVGQKVEALRDAKEEMVAKGNLESSQQRLAQMIEEMEEEYRRGLLQIGAAGRLLMEGDIEAVLPLEDADAYAAANPVKADGSVTLDEERIEARQDGQTRLLLDQGPFSVIILGGAQDLSDNLERLSDGTAEYVRVDVDAWRECSGRSVMSPKGFPATCIQPKSQMNGAGKDGEVDRAALRVYGPS